MLEVILLFLAVRILYSAAVFLSLWAAVRLFDYQPTYTIYGWLFPEVLILLKIIQLLTPGR